MAKHTLTIGPELKQFFSEHSRREDILLGKRNIDITLKINRVHLKHLSNSVYRDIVKDKWDYFLLWQGKEYSIEDIIYENPTDFHIYFRLNRVEEIDGPKEEKPIPKPIDPNKIGITSFMSLD